MRCFTSKPFSFRSDYHCMISPGASSEDEMRFIIRRDIRRRGQAGAHHVPGHRVEPWVTTTSREILGRHGRIGNSSIIYDYPFLDLHADMSCFQGLLFCPEVASLLLHNFCIYHINPQGHEVCSLCDIVQTCPLPLRDAWVSVGWVAHMIILMTFVKISMQLGAAPIPSDVPVPSVEDLADQVADVLDFFGYSFAS